MTRRTIIPSCAIVILLGALIWSIVAVNVGPIVLIIEPGHGVHVSDLVALAVTAPLLVILGIGLASEGRHDPGRG